MLSAGIVRLVTEERYQASEACLMNEKLAPIPVISMAIGMTIGGLMQGSVLEVVLAGLIAFIIGAALSGLWQALRR
jgi:hypothetical protein